MFKIFQRLFGSRPHPVRAAPIPTGHRAAPSRGSAPAPPATSPEEAAVQEALVRPRLDRSAPPEVMCGLTPGMSTDQIRDHLAMLYRRHNRAASSLDPDLREDAELMLDAIVRCRETFLGVPKPGTPA